MSTITFISAIHVLNALTAVKTNLEIYRSNDYPECDELIEIEQQLETYYTLTNVLSQQERVNRRYDSYHELYFINAKCVTMILNNNSMINVKVLKHYPPERPNFKKNLIQRKRQIKNYKNAIILNETELNALCDDECVICMEQRLKIVSIKTSCGHNFCGECFCIWIKNSNTCPTCRQNSPNFVYYVKYDKIIEDEIEQERVIFEENVKKEILQFEAEAKIEQERFNASHNCFYRIFWRMFGK
jgi:hypothetical protein